MVNSRCELPAGAFTARLLAGWGRRAHLGRVSSERASPNASESATTARRHLVTCPRCDEEFDLVTAGWCGCGRGHPSKICPGCERCLCDHPEYDRPALWREAPPALRVAGFEKLFVAHEALREEEDGMPGRQGEGSGRSGRGDLPRTDLPPRKLPYDEDYFGTGEEEGVVGERELSEREGEPPPDRPGTPGRSGR